MLDRLGVLLVGAMPVGAMPVGVMLGSAMLVAGCASPPAPPSETVLRVAPQAQQTVRGWGIYPCTIQNDRPNPRDYTLWNRPHAARLIWKELGISFFRSEILPGVYNAKRDDGSLDVPFLRASLERQLRLGASFGQKSYTLSLWSPPAPFKSPATTRGLDPLTKRAAALRPEREGALCRFIARVLLQLRSDGFALPLALSVQNEPNFASPLWNCCAYSPAQWQRVLVRLRHTLDESGLKNVALIGPEGGSYAMSSAFVGGEHAPVLGEAQFRAALGGFAFHGYTVESKHAPYPEQLRRVVLAMHRANKPVWMTEWSLPGDKPDPLDHALATAQRLAREMTFVPCDYWAWWQGWYPRHPKGEVLLTGRDDAHLHVSKTYLVLAKLWHLAPAGSEVHLISSNDADISGLSPEAVQAVAFKSATRQTLLLVNPTSAAKELQVNGLRGTSATPFVSDATRDMQAQPPVALRRGQGQWTLAPRCVQVVDVH